MGDITARDNLAALEKLRVAEITDETTLVSIDVEDLYTNVPILESVASAIKLAEETQLGSQRDRDYVRACLELVLTNNVFEFNGVHYLAKEGLPMGSNSSPVLADAHRFQPVGEHAASPCSNDGHC